MKCKDLLRMLNDYVDGELDESLCLEFEDYLEGCNPCRVVVDTMRKTIQLYRADGVYEMPIPFRERLHGALRERWNATHSAPDADTDYGPVTDDGADPARDGEG